MSSELKSLLFVILALVASSSFAQTEEEEPVNSRPMDNYEPVRGMSNTSRYRVAATSVALIITVDGDGAERAVCSGQLISTTLVLTARHCLEYTDTFSGTVETVYPSQLYILLDRFHTEGGLRINANVVPYTAGKDKNDFMVLKLQQPVALESRVIPSPGADPKPLDDLYIIHFPYGRPLMLTRRNCRATTKPVIEVDLPNFKHRCETDPSSSGAPIFNDQNELIGIHVGGGRGEAADTFSEGVLLSQIMAQSPLVRNTLLAVQSSQKSDTSAKSTDRRTVYKLQDGTKFVDASGNWSMISIGSMNEEKKILRRQQSSSRNENILWDSSEDVLYRIPKGGGSIRRMKTGASQWTVIGKATLQLE